MLPLASLSLSTLTNGCNVIPWRIFIASASLLLLLAGCATNTDYLESKSLPPVETADKQSQQRLGQLYPIPSLDMRAPKRFSLPLPPGAGLQDQADIAALETIAEEYWILTAQSPASTWTRTISYLESRNVPLTRKDTQSATIETGWFTEALQPGSEIRYRVWLEQGLQTGTTELHLLNNKRPLTNVPTTDTATVAWSNATADSQHLSWFADQLITVLNDTSLSTGDSFLAASIDLPAKVRIADIDDEPVIIAEADSQRLSQSIAKVLDGDGLDVYDSNVDQGVFYFDEETSKGFGSRFLTFIASLDGDKLFKNSKGQSVKTYDGYSLEQVLQHLPDEPVVNELFPNVLGREQTLLEKVPGLLLIQQRQRDNTVIYVRDGYGRPIDRERASDLLDLIRLRLI